MQETGLDLWVRKIPWSRKWQPTAVFLPWKCHGQRSLVGNMGFQTVLRQLSNTHKCKKKIFPCFYLECFETLKFLESIDFFFCRLSFNLDLRVSTRWNLHETLRKIKLQKNLYNMISFLRKGKKEKWNMCVCVCVCVLKGLGEESRRMHTSTSLGHLVSTRVQGGDGHSLFRALLFNSLQWFKNPGSYLMQLKIKSHYVV